MKHHVHSSFCQYPMCKGIRHLALGQMVKMHIWPFSYFLGCLCYFVFCFPFYLFVLECVPLCPCFAIKLPLLKATASCVFMLYRFDTVFSQWASQHLL